MILGTPDYAWNASVLDSCDMSKLENHLLPMVQATPPANGSSNKETRPSLRRGHSTEDKSKKKVQLVDPLADVRHYPNNLPAPATNTNSDTDDERTPLNGGRGVASESTPGMGGGANNNNGSHPPMGAAVGVDPSDPVLSTDVKVIHDLIDDLSKLEPHPSGGVANALPLPLKKSGSFAEPSLIMTNETQFNGSGGNGGSSTPALAVGGGSISGRGRRSSCVSTSTSRNEHLAIDTPGVSTLTSSMLYPSKIQYAEP